MTDLDRHLLHHRIYNKLFLDSLKTNASITDAHAHERKNIGQAYNKAIKEQHGLN